MTIYPIPPNSIYQEAFERQMTRRDSRITTLIWNRYLAAKDYSLDFVSDQAAANDFNSFLSTYNALGISDQALQLNTPIISTPDNFYDMYLKGFYGNMSDAMRKDIWNSFLVAKNYTSNPPDSAALRQEFSNYISALQKKSIYFESQTALSPEESHKRTIVMNVMDALNQYLNATQSLISVQSDLLIFYGKWQKELSLQMQKVPMLNKGAPGSLKIGTIGTTGTEAEKWATWTAEQYQFGYDNINLEDVIKWGYTKANSTPESTITFGDAASGIGAYTFKLEKTESNQLLTIGFKQTPYGYDQTMTVTLPKNASISDVTKSAGNDFKNIFMKCPDFVTKMRQPYIPDITNWLFDRAEEGKPIPTPVQIGIFWDAEGASKEVGNSRADITYGNYNDNAVAKENKFQFIITATDLDMTEGSGLTFTRYLGQQIKISFQKYPMEKPEVLAQIPTFDLRVQHGDSTALTPYIFPEATIKNQITTTIQNKLNSLKTEENFTLPFGPIALPGRYLGTDSSGEYAYATGPEGQVWPKTYKGTILDQSDLKKRIEEQAQLGLYAQNIQSFRDKISSLSGQAQSALGTTKDTLNQITDIWTTVLESIESIMKAILRSRR